MTRLRDFLIALLTSAFIIGALAFQASQQTPEPQPLVPMHAEAPRSGKWPKVRSDFLDAHPDCCVCGNTNRHEVEVHHILDFSRHKDRECDPANLLTICGPKGCNAHFWLAHCGDYRLPANPHVREDAALLRKRYEAARTQE